MQKRRPMGALEGEVLACLWGSDQPMTPSEVLDSIGDGLAYTTVMTILTRLWQKGLAEREPHGRAYAYAAAVTEAELTATRMRDALASSSNRKAALSRFVDGLSQREAATVRAALRDLEKR